MSATQTFWNHLPHPALMLAPMEDVTDTVFREIVLSTALPNRLHVLYTEFVSTDGLCHPIGREKVKHRLYVSSTERELLKKLNVKLVAQVWGNKPEKFREAIRYITEEYAFDGIDVNMGCPVKKIVQQGGCSALIGTPSLAVEILQAAKESTTLPVSVKTRTGLKQHQTEQWLEVLMKEEPAAIILHCRNQSDQSERPADWSQMNLAVELRNRLGYRFPLIGNGDIFTEEDATRFVAQTGADGAMIARGIFHNPWWFAQAGYAPNSTEKMQLLLKHMHLFAKTWGTTKPFTMLRRFFKIYARDFAESAHLKAELMESINSEDVLRILDKYGFGAERLK